MGRLEPTTCTYKGTAWEEGKYYMHTVYMYADWRGVMYVLLDLAREMARPFMLYPRFYDTLLIALIDFKFVWY